MSAIDKLVKAKRQAGLLRTFPPSALRTCTVGTALERTLREHRGRHSHLHLHTQDPSATAHLTFWPLAAHSTVDSCKPALESLPSHCTHPWHCACATKGAGKL